MRGLKFWQALTCFGKDQVMSVLQTRDWRAMYADVFKDLESRDDRVRNGAVIPLRILKAMASVTPYLYAFGAREASLICRPRAEDLPPDFTYLTPLEALENFGGEAMVEAVDYGSATS